MPIAAIGCVHRPSVMVYGGTIRAGCRPAMEEKLDIISAFQAYGQFVTGQINDEERPTLSLTLSPDLSPKRQPQPQPHPQPSPQPHPHPQPNPNQERLSLVESSCPGPGACGGMYTANTMASAIEALGLSVLLRVP